MRECPWEMLRVKPGRHSLQNTWTGCNAPCHLQHPLAQLSPGSSALPCALSLGRSQRGSTKSRRWRIWMEKREMAFLAQSLKLELLPLLNSSRYLLQWTFCCNGFSSNYFASLSFAIRCHGIQTPLWGWQVFQDLQQQDYPKRRWPTPRAWSPRALPISSVNLNLLLLWPRLRRSSGSSTFRTCECYRPRSMRLLWLCRRYYQNNRTLRYHGCFRWPPIQRQTLGWARLADKRRSFGRLLVKQQI